MSSYTDADVAPTGATPLPVMIGREVARVAAARGVARYGWIAMYDGLAWTAYAYIGATSSLVAMSRDRDMQRALARLLGELFQCTVVSDVRAPDPAPARSARSGRRVPEHTLPAPHAEAALPPLGLAAAGLLGELKRRRP